MHICVYDVYACVPTHVYVHVTYVYVHAYYIFYVYYYGAYINIYVCAYVYRVYGVHMYTYVYTYPYMSVFTTSI